jgi:hypothetical protein
VNGHRSRLAEPPSQPAATPDEPHVVQLPTELTIVTRLRKQHAATHELRQQGMSKAGIGRKLGLHQATVRKLVDRFGEAGDGRVEFVDAVQGEGGALLEAAVEFSRVEAVPHGVAARGHWRGVAADQQRLSIVGQPYARRFQGGWRGSG